MIQNRRAYQLIHCHTRSRLLAGAAAVCGAACGHADLGLYHLLHRGGAPLPDSTQADRAALAALCPKPAAEETCPLLPPQDPTVTLSVIVPAFVTSELERAFMMGFLLYLPFLVIDMIVSSTLMSMGMVMLPPSTIAMPFKLLLFVLVDGWGLIMDTLVRSFR